MPRAAKRWSEDEISSLTVFVESKAEDVVNGVIDLHLVAVLWINASGSTRSPSAVGEYIRRRIWDEAIAGVDPKVDIAVASEPATFAAFSEVLRLLAEIPGEDRSRVLRAACVFYGVEP